MIVNSSTEDTTLQYTLVTQPNYDPPPAGQQPPKSSLPNGTTSHQPDPADFQTTAAKEPCQTVSQDLDTPANHIARCVGTRCWLNAVLVHVSDTAISSAITVVALDGCP